jgi:hypothetical protein
MQACCIQIHILVSRHRHEGVHSRFLRWWYYGPVYAHTYIHSTVDLRTRIYEGIQSRFLRWWYYGLVYILHTYSCRHGDVDMKASNHWWYYELVYIHKFNACTCRFEDMDMEASNHDPCADDIMDMNVTFSNSELKVRVYIQIYMYIKQQWARLHAYMDICIYVCIYVYMYGICTCMNIR